MKLRHLFLIAVLVVLSFSLSFQVVIAEESQKYEVTINVKDSNDNAIDGALVRYYKNGNRHVIGNTDVEGTIKVSLLPGTYQFEAVYAGTTSERINCEITDKNVEITFNTTKVEVNVVDSSGQNIKDVLVRYYVNGNRHQLGKTNDEGIASHELFTGTYKFEAVYAGTTSERVEYGVTGKNYKISFKTAKAAIKVVDSNGQNVKGVLVRYYINGNRHQLGTTDDEGIASGELFPGTYQFEAFINGTTSERQDFTVGEGLTGEFKATNVYINAKGTIKVYTPGAITFKNGMVFFPGTYRFEFNGKASQYITIGENKVEKTFALLELKDSKGNGISDATAKYYVSGWKNAEGTTDENGYLLIVIDGLANKVTVQVWHKGGNNSLTQNILDNSVFKFQTRLVTFRLLDSNGNAFDAEKYSGQFYALSWKEFDVNAEDCKQVELLPAEYSFGVRYMSAWMQKKQDIAKDPAVEFQTGLVDLHFTGGTIQFYTSNWYNYNGPVELLPVKTSFYFNVPGLKRYSVEITPVPGTKIEKSAAFVHLKDSNGKGISGVNVNYFKNNTWYKEVATTDSNGNAVVLIDGVPKKISVQVKYKGGWNQIDRQDFDTNSIFTFQTAKVVIKLKVNGKYVKANEFSSQFFASSWETIDGVDDYKTIELLPRAYSFAVSYNGKRIQKNDVVINENTENVVEFEIIQ